MSTRFGTSVFAHSTIAPAFRSPWYSCATPFPPRGKDCHRIRMSARCPGLSWWTNLDCRKASNTLQKGHEYLSCTLYALKKGRSTCSEHTGLFLSSSQSMAYSGTRGARLFAALVYSGERFLQCCIHRAVCVNTRISKGHVRKRTPHQGATNATIAVFWECC